MNKTNNTVIKGLYYLRRGKCSNLAHFPTPSLKNKKTHPEKNFYIFSKKSHPKQISYAFMQSFF